MATGRASLRIGLLIVLSVVLAACAGRDVESDLGMTDAPDWVNEGTRALADDDGRVFHGVGSAPTMDDPSLQRSTADTRARADLAAVLGTYMDAVIDDYSGSAGSAGFDAQEQTVRREIEAVTRVNLSGSRIIARWKDEESGTIYSLAELDMDHVQNAVTTVDDMHSGLREHMREEGGNIFDRVSEREGGSAE